LDFQTRIGDSYHTNGVPETFIINQDGRLAFVKTSHWASADEIRQAVDALLKP
jgi:peroxiredoxin